MKQYTYTTKNGFKQRVTAQNLTSLYEKIKDNYTGNVEIENVKGKWGEIIMPKVKKQYE